MAQENKQNSRTAEHLTFKLDQFEGPLDLLLHLIKQNEMDIYDIQVAEITSQYIDYLHQMQDLRLDIAGEYLVIAATLLNIKSKMLLPVEQEQQVEEDYVDPREDLVQQLVSHQLYQEVAAKFHVMEKQRMELFSREQAVNEDVTYEVSEGTTIDLLQKAFAKLMARKQVKKINEKHATLDKPFKFRTHSGAEITTTANGSYGWKISEQLAGQSLAHAMADNKKNVNAKSDIYGIGYNRRGTGYGVVIPEKNEITLEEPVVIRQGNKYGVKIKSASPSIHMIKANIETEIAPIVGSEEQAQDLIAFIKENEKTADGGMWETNIFGKSIEQLVEDGIRTKIAQISEESQVKLQDTMQKIVNDSKGGLICIII